MSNKTDSVCPVCFQFASSLITCVKYVSSLSHTELMTLVDKYAVVPKHSHNLKQTSHQLML